MNLRKLIDKYFKKESPISSKPKGCKYPNKICRYIEGGIIGELCDYCKIKSLN